MSDTDCPHLAAWMRAPPRIGDSFDEAAFAKVCEALVEMGTTCARAGLASVFRAALVKVLGAVDGAPALDLTEEDVFARSHRLREALYLEVMSYRRAARADVDMEELRG